MSDAILTLGLVLSGMLLAFTTYAALYGLAGCNNGSQLRAVPALPSSLPRGWDAAGRAPVRRTLGRAPPPSPAIHFGSGPSLALRQGLRAERR
jgi:hypothetical protein